jgi:hypothetical protein
MSKMKTHFAQKVNVKMTPKESSVNGSFNAERMRVLAETNSPLRMVCLDKTIHQKTELEKIQLKQAKLQHKVDVLNGK